MTSDDPKNRRRFPRVPFVLKVLAEGPERPIPMTTANVSACGAFLVGPADWKVGDTIRATLSFPRLLEDCPVEAVVRWAQPALGEHPPGFGIEWDAASADVVLKRALELDALSPEDEARELRVLVADDSQLLRKMIGDGVRRLGRKENLPDLVVVEAVNGRDAWEKLEAERFDLLLLDLNMPELDGLHVLERIRGHETMCTLPVAVITAAGRQMSQEVLDAGADLFLAKPIKLVDLLHTVRTLLRLKD